MQDPILEHGRRAGSDFPTPPATTFSRISEYVALSLGEPHPPRLVSNRLRQRPYADPVRSTITVPKPITGTAMNMERVILVGLRVRPPG